MPNNELADNSVLTQDQLTPEVSSYLKNELIASPQIATVINDPGGQLKRAREERRYTRAEIAVMLRLNVNVITALEENNYSLLTIPTFVRGYLRSYANLLDLTPEPLIEAYERNTGNNSKVPVNIITPQKESNLDRIWHFFSYIVIIGLIILVAMWWRNDSPELKNNGLDTSSPLEIKPGLSVLDDKTVSESSLRSLRELTEIGPPIEDAATTTHFTSSADNANNSTAAPTTANNGTDAALKATETQTVNATETNHQSSVTPAPSPQPPNVTIKVSANTQVKVQDHKGKKLFNGLIKAGEAQIIHGQTPFKIRLKQIEGVTVEYNGQPFDFSKFIKKNGANFVVGNK